MKTHRYTAGTVVEDRFEIVEFIGAGGFASVYKAKQLHVDRMVALKFLAHAPQGVDADEFERRFMREAKLAAQIDHANVVTIYDFGFTGPQRMPFIAMELLEGCDLAVWLAKNGALAPERVLRLFKGCLEALGEGHNRGIIHKDLKPSNLYLYKVDQPRESLRILDFGVARLAEVEDGAALTGTGQIMGTPKYLPPEYIRNQIATCALDVYQMGLILVEMLTGHPVVEETSPFACLLAHAQGGLDIPESLLEGKAGAILWKALNPNYQERYPDANAFLADLETLSAQDLVVSDTKMKFSEYRQRAAVVHSGELPAVDAAALTANARPVLAVTPPESDASALGGDAVMPPAGEGEEDVALAPASGRRLILVAIVVLLLLSLVGVVIHLSRDDGPPESTARGAAADAMPGASAADPGLTAVGEGDAGTGEDPADAAKTAGEPIPGADGAPGDDAAAAVDDATVDAETAAVDPEKAAMVTVRIETEPAGAGVFRDGESLGLTPTDVTFPRDDAEEVRLVLKRDGFDDSVMAFIPRDGLIFSRALTPAKRSGGGSSKRRGDDTESKASDPTVVVIRQEDKKPEDKAPVKLIIAD